MTVARQPQDLHDLFVKAFNAGDLEQLVALYEPGAVLVPNPGQPATGTGAIRAAYQGFLAMKPKIVLDTRGIFETGDGLALMHGHWVMTATGPDGAPLRMEGRNTEVARRQPDGTWLWVIDNPFTPD